VAQIASHLLGACGGLDGALLDVLLLASLLDLLLEILAITFKPASLLTKLLPFGRERFAIMT